MTNGFPTRDRQWTGLHGGPGGNFGGGGSSGSTDNPTSKKFHFCIIHIILNKIDVKSLDLVNFVNFADAPQGVKGGTPHPYWRTLVPTLVGSGVL